MAESGVRTPSLPSLSEADSLVGNREESTGAIPVAALANQLAALGPLGLLGGRLDTAEGQLSTNAASIEDHEDRVATLESIGATGMTPAAGGPVACATTANITLSGEQTIDDVLTSSSRVLVKAQTAPEENGIYVSASGAWSRAADMDEAGEFFSTSVSVTGGTVEAGRTYYCQSTVTTVDTDAVTFGLASEVGPLIDGKVSYSDGAEVSDLEFSAILDANNLPLLAFGPAGQARVNDLEVANGATLETSSLAFGVYAPAKNAQIIGVGEDGKVSFVPSPWVLRYLRNNIWPTSAPLHADPRIAVHGDSMLPITVTDGLAATLGREVFKGSVGGLTTRSIAALQGGVPAALTLDGGEIPASGSVNVTTIEGEWNNQTSDVRTGSLMGVLGTLDRNGGAGYTFTRFLDGGPVTVPAGSPFIMDQNTEHRSWTHIIGAGRNDWAAMANGDGAGTGILERRAAIRARVEMIEAMAQYLSPIHQRCLVLSVHTGTSQGTGTDAHTIITGFNTELAATFGDRYVDLRRYMVDHAIYDAINAGLLDSGSYPTADDLSDMAADTVPRSLITDGVHYTSIGWQMKSEFLARQILNRGW